MNTMKNLGLAFALTLLIGCASLYSTTITITKVVDSAMKNWAQLSVAGKSTAAIDAKVVQAHDQYRAACAVAQSALIAYKASGDQAPYIAALTAAKTAASGILDLITPLLTASQSTTLKANLTKASSI